MADGIDEVEEIAGLREHRSPSAAQGVTNEMLKLIPRFREQDRRLLVCATNSVRALDKGVRAPRPLRYLIPVGPPDAEARRAIWERYLTTIPHEDLDLDEVVKASKLFTPGDIEFAARRTAQLLFERVSLTEGGERATTADLADYARL